MDDRAQTMGRGQSSEGLGLKPALGQVDRLFQNQDALLAVAQLGGAKGQEGLAQLLSFAKKLVSDILAEEFQIQKDGPANRYPPAMIEALDAHGLNTPQGRLVIRMEALASGRSPEQLALDRTRDPNELILERKVEQYQALASAGRFDVLSPQFKDDRSFAPYQDLWPNLRPETQRAVGEMQAEWNSIASFWDQALKGERPAGPIPDDRWGIKEIALQRLEEKGIAQLTAMQSDLASGRATVERMQEHLKVLDHCTSLLGPGWEQKHLDQVFGKEAEALREVLQFRADFVEGKKEYWHRTIQEGKPAAELWDNEHYQPLREYRDAALANGTYGPLVEAIQKEAETVHLAYAGLHQAKEGWWQAHVKGEPTGVWEEKAKEARLKLAECDPGASALWGSSHAWNVDREYTEKINRFERSYEQRWEALLSGDATKLAQAEAGLQELPGFSSAETRALDEKYQPQLKESYLRVQGLLNGSPGLAPEDREASQALLDLWRDNVPESLLNQWEMRLTSERTQAKPVPQPLFDWSWVKLDAAYPIQAPHEIRPTDWNREWYDYVLNQFDVVNQERYEPGRRGSTYCNIFVWDATRAMGVELPHWVDKVSGKPVDANEIRRYYAAHGYPGGDDDPYRELDANATTRWLRNEGQSYSWKKVTAQEAQEAANQGVPSVVAWENKGGIGHIAMVRPGTFDPNKGPTIAQAGATNYRSATVYDGFRRVDGLEYYIYDGPELSEVREGVRVDSPEITHEKFTQAKTDRERFEVLKPQFLKAEAETGIPWEIHAAQWALESGWGKSTPKDANSGQESFNFFGIKGNSRPGTNGVVYAWTWEERKGQKVKELAPFRAYNNVVESIQDHTDLLNSDYYAPVRACGGDINCVATMLGPTPGVGYATDSAYAEKLLRCIEQFKGW